jgi:hypothetical protein
VTIVYEGALAERGAPPQIVHLAQVVEDFCVEHLLTNVRVFRDGAVGRYIIEVDQSYNAGREIITTVKEFDL